MAIEKSNNPIIQYLTRFGLNTLFLEALFLFVILWNLLILLVVCPEDFGVYVEVSSRILHKTLFDLKIHSIIITLSLILSYRE